MKSEKVEYLATYVRLATDNLNELGQDGWRLLITLHNAFTEAGEVTYCIFSRNLSE